MVNEKLLQILISSDNSISGQKLSNELGISRVAVWKHIQTLQTLGYEIESCRKGYKLLKRPDVLTHIELDDSQVIHFASLESSMDKARKLIFDGLTDNKIIITETQSAGKSLSGRPWESTAGGFYGTFIYFPENHPSDSWRYSLSAGNAVIATLKKLYNIPAKTVWPSEIWVNDKKIGGILVEYLCNSHGYMYLNIGIGINVNNVQHKSNRTSVSQLVNTSINRKSFFKALKSNLNKSLSELENSVQNWLPTLHKEKTLDKLIPNIKKTANYCIEGINSQGALIINGDGGRIYKTIEGPLPIHLDTNKEII